MSDRRDDAAGPIDPGDAPPVQGVIDRVTFHDPDSLYTVLRILPEPGFGDPEDPSRIVPTRVSAVGHAGEPAEGLRVRLSGRWSLHPKHGRQLAFDALEVLPPADEAGLVKYLGSKVFEGVGETLAKRIVATLGRNALARIRDEPESLRAVEGLRAPVRERLVATVRSQLAQHEARAFLATCGLGPTQARRVLERVGPDCEARIRADPYLLSTGIQGLGFRTADRVAGSLGFGAASPERLRAALVFALREAASEGHSLLARDALLEAASAVLGEAPPADALRAALVELADAGEVVLERADGEPLVPPVGDDLGPDVRAWLPALLACERALARNLAALLARGAAPPLAQAEDLARAEARAGIELHPRQREAVLGLLARPLALLTGGPGVGKTTIVRLVVELAEARGRRVLLASPTGRAAKRLAEATGREASTIHRMLGYDPESRGFEHAAGNPLEADLVVVDEISMLDLVLAHHLAKAVQPPTRLVLVGDPDQLPSVQAGNVLADLIASERVPCFRLTEIFRQQRESLIVRNAHAILRGEIPDLPARDDAGSDFYFFPADEEESAARRLIEVVTERIPKRFGLEWIEDVQVIAPMYKGACGVDRLNEDLRAALGIGGREVRIGDRTWRVGDRVIHTRNDYEKQVFNGDLGRLVEIRPDGETLVVRYPEREVEYARRSYGDLAPAFAITVHRAQGCEFPAVVVPLTMRHARMLERNLLYTAVTRARRLVVLVGSRRALALAVANAGRIERASALAERLVRALPERVPGPVRQAHGSR